MSSEGRNFFQSGSRNGNYKYGDKYLVHYFLGMTVLVSLLVVLTAELNLYILNVKITSSLKLSVDVKLNPGPYQMIRSVQRSFSEGNVAPFWEIAGRQCACNASFSIC